MLVVDAFRTATLSSRNLAVHHRMMWFLELYRCLRRGHREDLPARDRDCTAIVLSYKRPQNIAPLVGLLLKAPSIRQVIVSNNNPGVSMGDWLTVASPRLCVVEQPTAAACHIRYEIARQQDSKLFLAIDDDVFLRPSQIETLCAALRADPVRPYGIFGSSYDDDRCQMQFSIKRPGDVDILNMAYAFTSDHVRRFFELTGALGFGPAHEAWESSAWDDMVISHAGRSKPRICDIGAFTECPTSSEHGIAAWRAEGFMASRVSLFHRIRALPQALAPPAASGAAEP